MPKSRTDDMTASRTPHGTSPRGLADRVNRYRSTFLAAVLAGLLLGLIGLLAVPRKYSATSTVTISSVNSSPLTAGRLVDQINMQTEESIATSRSVTTAAAKLMTRRIDPDDLRDLVRVSVPSQSFIVKFTGRSSDKDLAIEAANAVANAYLTDRSASAAASTKRIVDSLQADVDALVKQRTAESDDARRAVYDATIQQLRTQLGVARLVPLNPGRIVTAAAPPAKRSSPAWWTVLFGGTVLGGLAGMLLALIRDRTDRHIRWGERLTELYAAPVLGMNMRNREQRLRDVLGVVAAHGEQNPDGSLYARAVLLSIAPDGVDDVIEGMKQVARSDRFTLTVKRASVQELATLGMPTAPSAPEYESISDELDDAGRRTGKRRYTRRMALHITDATGFDVATQATVAANAPTALLVASSSSLRSTAQEMADGLNRNGAVPDVVIFRGPTSPDSVRIGDRVKKAVTTDDPTIAVDHDTE